MTAARPAGPGRISAGFRRPSFRPAAQRGFTLIEVLVAVALMAVVSIVSWRGLDSVIRVRDRVDDSAARSDALLRVLGQLQTDVRMRAPDAVMLGGATMDPPPAEGALPPALRLDGAAGGPRLEIVRGPAEGGRWQRVRWWRDGDVLRRAAAPAGGTFPLPEPAAQDGAAVLGQVAGFAVQAWIPGQGWVALPAQRDAPAATGLAFILSLAGAGQEGPQVYRRVVELP